jgi:hypothetical protein
MHCIGWHASTRLISRFTQHANSECHAAVPQVLVRLKLRPVHPADLMAVAGRHIIRPPPFVPGSEVRAAVCLWRTPAGSSCRDWRPWLSGMQRCRL